MNLKALSYLRPQFVERMNRILVILFVVCYGSLSISQDKLSADDPYLERERYESRKKFNLDSLEASLDYEFGTIKFRNGANLNLPSGYKFLPNHLVNFIYKEVLDLPNAPVGTGLVFNVQDHFMSDHVAEIRYVDSGYVEERPISEVNTEQLILELQTTVSLARDSMRVWGQKPEFLVGWHKFPELDTIKHLLTWVERYVIDDQQEDEIQMEARLLGRFGYFILSMRGTLTEEEKLTDEFETLLSSLNFEIGSKYSDYKECCDVVYPYTSNHLLGPIELRPPSWFDRNWKWILAITIVIAILVRRRYAASRKARSTN